MGKSQEVKETPQERALAEIAMARMQDYRERFLPLTRKLAENVRADGAAGSAARRQAAGKTSTDNAVRFGEARTTMENALAAGGAAPVSGKFRTASAGLSNDQATSRSLGLVASDAAIDDAYVTGLGKVAALGKGQAGAAIEGMGAMARRSAQQAAQDAEMALAQRSGRAQLGAQAVGFGLAGGFKGMGDAMQAKFSQTQLGGSGFGTGLAYGNQDLGAFI
jgi:hypothetical protein